MKQREWWDGNVITGDSVSAGIDHAVILAAELPGKTIADAI